MRVTPDLLLAAAAWLVLATAAEAETIAPGSVINFSDGASYSATSITFLNDNAVNVPASMATGSFADAFGAGCTGCATFNNFTYSPFTGPTAIYTATLGNVTTSFSLDTLTTDTITGSSLDLGGLGTLTLTGYDPTPGTFSLSAQGPEGINVAFTADADATAVPEPASIALLGASLATLGVIRRRR